MPTSEVLPMPKLMFIVTVPLTVRVFLKGQLAALQRSGFDIVVVSSPGQELQEIAQIPQVRVFGIPMQREINPYRDGVALWKLAQLMRHEQPDIVNASTPKAGMLGTLAACFARVPVRIYQLRGLRLETTSGLKRLVLKLTELTTSRIAHQIVCNSESLRQNYISQHLAPPSKLIVLGHGSSNGVDPERFLPNATLLAEAERLRRQLDIPSDAQVVGYVGRFTRDKGIVELISTYDQLTLVHPETYLLLVGEFEDGDPVPAATRERIINDPKIKQTGFVNDTAAYYQMMDLLVFSSYREGLPNVPLEAALAGIPTVGFRTTGVIDAVKDRVTGVLVPLNDNDALAQAVLQLLNEPELRHRLGANAQAWVLANFNPVDVWQRWIEFYSRCLENHVSSNN